MSSKIDQAFEKTTKFSIRTGLKSTLIRQLKRTINQCKISYMKKNIFLCKNVLLYTIINISMLLEIIVNKFSSILKIMSRNTFPEPQPDSVSYPLLPPVARVSLYCKPCPCPALVDLALTSFSFSV